MVYFLQFLYSHWFFTPPYPTKKFTGQTVIVTGANCGLGLEAARHFVRLDAKKVILACRNIDKAEVARKSIDQSENRPGVAEVWHLDLASYESVKQFAKKAEELDRLDVVIENAGMLTRKWRMMEDDEATITTNVVSTFLLGLLLLPKMRETAVKYNALPRLSFVASFVHHLTTFPEGKADNIFAELADKDKANMADRYNVSKTMDIFATRELAALVTVSSNKPNIIVNCLNPGFAYSEAMRESGPLQAAIFKTFRPLFARNTEVGSRTLIAAAIGGEETHGQYMDDCRVGKLAQYITDESGARIQKKVWVELSEKLEKIQPGILRNI